MINSCIIQGRLTHDPELKMTKSNVPYCKFTVAWSEKRKDTGEETVLFMRCTAWRGTAEFIGKYFAKGREIVVQGKLVPNAYTDDKGVEHKSIDLNVDAGHFTGKKSDNDAPQASTQPAAPTDQQTGMHVVDEGELPF